MSKQTDKCPNVHTHVHVKIPTQTHCVFLVEWNHPMLDPCDSLEDPHSDRSQGSWGGGSSTMCFMGLHVFSFSYSKWKIKNIFVLWTSHYHSHNNEVLVFIFTKQQTWTLADEASSRWPCSHNIPKFMSCLLCLCFIKDVVTWHRALNRRTWYMRVKHKNEKINVVLVCKKKILHESFNLKPTSDSAYIRLAEWQIGMTCN